MDARNASNEVSLLTFPAELIQEIGNYLDTPKDLLNFSCTCRSAHSAIGLREMVEKDADCQKNVVRIMPQSRDGEIIQYLHLPGLYWAIKEGKDIDYVQSCIDVYRKSFPEGLEGHWFLPFLGDWDDFLQEYSNKFIYVAYSSPMYLAASHGRLDVVRALAECGVNVRGRVHGKSIYIMTTEQQEYDSYRSDDTFRIACESKLEETAKFLVSEGLKLKEEDLWIAAKSGCLQVVNTLLLDPFFTSGDAQRIIIDTLKAAVSCPVDDLEIIRPLLNAVNDQDFNKAHFLREHIDKRLDKIPRGIPSRQQSWYTEEPCTLLSIFVDVASPPFDGKKFAIGFAASDSALETIKAVLSGHPWVIGDSESERSETLQSALDRAIDFGCVEIPKFLISLGMCYTTRELRAAIGSKNLGIIDEVANSGISVNSTKHGDSKTPLEQALSEGGLNGRSNYLPACRLLYHGADYTNISDSQKDDIYRCVWLTQGFRKFLSKRTDHDLQVAPSRQTFAQLPPLGWHPQSLHYLEYLQIVHAMVCLVLGDEYWKEMKKRGPAIDSDANYESDASDGSDAS
ncbi:hypothetical protein F4781DRAFT_407176 [Annulohypoxylon bovei var. microspora]|nr:hypothetical protein F4781DRAFT_407176 [Annulohypoxylon bovei var. microspora]